MLICFPLQVKEYNIANDDYAGTNSDLPGVYKDGTAMNTALKAYGWNVKLVRNKTASQMKSAIASCFKGKLKTDVCLVYYSGHGDDSKGGTGGSLVGIDGSWFYPTELRDALKKNTKDARSSPMAKAGSKLTFTISLSLITKSLSTLFLFL